MNPSFWRLAWRALWRDARAGELRLLILAVSLAVAALSSVSFFADRIEAGLQRDARQLLGGDAVVASDHALSQAWVDQARDLGLASSTTISFPTMARALTPEGGDARLVALKVVGPGYPLRGQLKLRSGESDEVRTMQDGPPAGEVWVDPALLEALALAPGESLGLGNAQLRVGALIESEPDRGAGFMNFAPRVMMNQADVAASALIQPASRLTYRMAVAGPEASVQAFVRWAQVQIQDGQTKGVRVETLESGRPEMRQTLDRASKFLHLVALLSALLSAVAVGVGARSFAQRHLDHCAMLRVLGLSQRSMTLAYLTEFVLVGLGASALGVVLGWGIHHVFVQLLADLVGGGLPPVTAKPVWLGLGVGLTLLAAFGLPPVLQLARVPALRVLRRDLGAPSARVWWVWGLGLMGFAGLLMAVSADRLLGLVAVGGFAAAALIFAGVAWVVLQALQRVVTAGRGPQWLVMATRQVTARPGFAVVQVSALAVGLLALVLLVLMRTDLIASWRQATPADAVNRFVINVMPDQAAEFQQVLRDEGVQGYDWYPMIRGRLVAVNGRPVSPQDYTEDRAQRLVDREFNLSHSAEAPPHNTVVAGRWVPEEVGAISMEDGIARTLGLKLGDRLSFDTGGVVTESKITSLRKVDWGSMRANFFAMYTVSQMPDMPVTYMGAFRAPERKGFDSSLVRRFPNITQVDMSATIRQVQTVLDQVIQAVEFLFAFTLAAGLLVLGATVAATREERARDFAIMRALGAQAGLLGRVQTVELAGLGFLAGGLASTVACVVGWVLARQVFEFELRISWWIPVAGAMGGAFLSWLAGWWGLRAVLRRPVVDTLRQVML